MAFPVLVLAHQHSGSGTSAKTDAQKITDALRAGPASITRNAAVMDWPIKAGEKPRQLRAGTNGWVCFPSTPIAGDGDPMCLDKQWQAWGEAWLNKTPPKVTGFGIAYMLYGDRGVSNIDPFATKPTNDNQWVASPPHIMVLFEDMKLLDAYSTDPKTGGPWVMWKGTPYAHLMVPVSGSVTSAQQMLTRYCEQHPPAVLKELRDGSRQVIIVVKAFTPPTVGNSSLTAAFIAPNGKRYTLGRFAVHPLRAFTSQEPARQQRFSFSLASVKRLIKDDQPLCIEVTFASGRAARTGKVEFGVELEKKP